MNQPNSDRLLDEPARLEQKISGSTKEGLRAPGDVRNADGSSLHGSEDVLALQDLDPALNMKMHLVNNVSGGAVALSSRSPRPRQDPEPTWLGPLKMLMADLEGD